MSQDMSHDKLHGYSHGIFHERSAAGWRQRNFGVERRVESPIHRGRLGRADGAGGAVGAGAKLLNS